MPISSSRATLPELDVDWCRRQFPALERQHARQTAVFFDGPAGSQVPRRVAQAVSDYLLKTNANHGGLFATSRESDELLDAAHAGVADFLGAANGDEVAFGANMTSLTFAFSRALARTWRAGDEVLVTQLDHDANFTPWMLAARDAGAVARPIRVRADDCTLDMDDLRAMLNSRTRLVAVSCASNAVGTVQPVKEICQLAHAVGAEVFLDAVHYAPHGPIDVTDWGCDYLVCSAYKFFGPHVGVFWGRRERLLEIAPYKLRPAADSLPGRWMTGTQSHEGIAGTLAAIDYLADLGRQHGDSTSDRRAALRIAWEVISDYERRLAQRLLRGLAERPSLKIWGITDPARARERVPTVGIRHAKFTASEVASFLAERGIFVWHGNFYALPLTEALNLEPDGIVRIGLLHYNTVAEVDRLLESLKLLDRS